MAPAQAGDGVRLEPARPGDLAAMAHLAELAGDAGWREADLAQELARDWAQVTVARGGGDEVAGFCVCWWVADEGQLLYIAVQPSRRRRGVGRRLVQALVKDARRRGAVRIDLEVRRDNDAALALYRCCGFVAVGERRGYYQKDGVDALLMSVSVGRSGSRGS